MTLSTPRLCSTDGIKNEGAQSSIFLCWKAVFDISRQLTDLDAVLVLYSNEYYTECIVSAVDNKKHVLVEKPMCYTFRKADEIFKTREYRSV